ncbi:hypothetical protein K227x_24350 [Rubripirellula lacrimiformis]|uniref:Uncharacterized protein n=1 Tax=Rubripirellula lacrimiformis TaxID=1930273 RepID=A0A517NA86_9BACT|nr:hypothetical protein [Rubripirellula lacrimiformis]QDT04049.1 hypothetical protein K227x_24350 [Rubripirellula lacrimiformis]
MTTTKRPHLALARQRTRPPQRRSAAAPTLGFGCHRKPTPVGSPAVRCGSVIIEVVLAVSLLAVAGVALTKLSRGASMLGRTADQHLAATLAAENTLERMRALPTGQWSTQGDAIASAVGNDTQCTVTVAVDDFQSGPNEGVHIQVQATLGDAVTVRQHDWIVREPKPDAAADDVAADDAAADDDVADADKPDDDATDADDGDADAADADEMTDTDETAADKNPSDSNSTDKNESGEPDNQSPQEDS